MRRYVPVLLSGLLPLGALLGAIYVGLQRLPIVAPSPTMAILIRILLTFLILLIVRYALLLWFGYLHHVEEKIASAEENTFTPPVSILVPCFNEEAVIGPAIRYLLDLDYPAYEIIVIDDGSTDGTYAKAAEYEGRFGNVTVRVLSKANAGKANALNTGIALARNPFVVCMDGDTKLARDAIRSGMRHFRDPRIGAVAGNLKVINRVNVWSKLQALEYLVGMNMLRRAQAYFRVVNIIPGPLGIFRREALQQVGGYDTDTYAEDADLTIKILRAGWGVVSDDGAFAYTEVPEKLLDLIKQRYRWGRGVMQALRKQRWRMATPRGGGLALWVSLQVMFFEGLVWPIVNVGANLTFAITALRFGVSPEIFYWWVLFTLLDCAAALFVIAQEEEDLSLVPYAFLYRFFFIQLIDVAKVFATIEEFADVQMSWGKLDRAGRI